MRPLILKRYDVKSYRSESKVLYHFFFFFQMTPLHRCRNLLLWITRHDRE